MKTAKLIAALMLTFAAFADEPIVVETLFSDGTTNTWTQADLVQALQLMNRKYHRDIGTKEGRKAWHGRVVREIVNTNDLTKTTVYEDGQTFTDPAQITTPADAAAAQLKKLPKVAQTNGVPVRLANARKRQVENAATTNIVTVTLGK